MNLLEIVKEFCGRVGLVKPSIVASSQDTQYLQLIGLLNEVLDYIVSMPGWQNFVREATFASVAETSQGYVTDICDQGFLWITPGTMFDRTSGLPIWGPLSAQEWQTIQSTVTSAPQYSYRISEDKINLTPTPEADHNIYFEYASEFAVSDALKTAYKKYFTSDTDICSLPDSILLQGLKYSWKREKGFRFADDFAKFEGFVADYLGRSGTKKTLHMDSCGPAVGPGIMVPSGSWSVE